MILILMRQRQKGYRQEVSKLTKASEVSGTFNIGGHPMPPM